MTASASGDRLRIPPAVIDGVRAIARRAVMMASRAAASAETAPIVRSATLPLVSRGCRPALHPGAEYGIAAGATVLRGRVHRTGTARVVANQLCSKWEGPAAPPQERCTDVIRTGDGRYELFEGTVEFVRIK